jgi:hypothetical protein
MCYHKTIFALLFLILGNSQGFHLVKFGETLSGVALKYFTTPIYSSKGSLAKLLKINPEIEDPNLVYPGQRINLRQDETKENQMVKIEINDDLDDQNISFWATASFAYFFIKSKLLDNDSLAYAYSDLSPGLKVGVDIEWSKSFSTFTSLQFQHANFSISDNKNLKGSKRIKSYLDMGLIKKIGNLDAILSFQVSNSYFLRSVDIDSLTIENNLASFLSTSLDWHLFKSNNLGLSFGPEFALLIPLEGSNFYYTNGHKWNLHMSQHFTYMKRRYRLKLYYDLMKLQTNQVEQTSTQIALELTSYY